MPGKLVEAAVKVKDLVLRSNGIANEKRALQQRLEALIEQESEIDRWLTTARKELNDEVMRLNNV